MALPKGWITLGFGNVIAAGIDKTAAAVSRPYGIEPKELGKPEERILPPDASPLALAMSYAGGVIGSPMGLLPALMIKYQSGKGQEDIYDSQRAFDTARISPDTFSRLVFRNFITGDNFDAWLRDLRDQGWTETRVQGLLESYRTLMSLAEIRDAYLRGLFGEGKTGKNKAKRKIMAYGFNSEDADHLIELFYVLPPPQDVIRWAAREVFEPELRELFRLDEDLPPDFTKWAAKVGITGEVAANYWAAHWELPSILMVLDSWHRGIITEDVLDSFMVQLDMNPYWRDIIKQQSYAVPTRVDVRRMYRAGAIDEAGVFDFYKLLHYSDENARQLTDFTMKFYPPEEDDETNEVRELTKSELLRGYREQVIDRETALGGLDGLGYTPGIAEFLVTIEDIKLNSEYIKERLKYIYAAYKAGRIGDAELTAELGALNLAGDEIEYHRDKLLKEDSEKIAIPSLGDFKRWLKRGIITEPQFRAELTVKGYTGEHIEYYVAEVQKTPAGELTNE